MSDNIGILYLIKFTGALGTERHRAQYYLGYCEAGNLESRLNEHRNGQGAAITRAAVQRGFSLEVVATSRGTRKDERRYKNWKNHKKVAGVWLKEGTND